MVSNFDRVEVFSATVARDRIALGEKVTRFLKGYDGRIVDKVVTQSSDQEFHCITITLFCQDNKKRRTRNGKYRDQGGE